MRFMAMSMLALMTMTPLMGQASATVACTVRIRPQAAAGYDPSTELVLRGTVAAARAGSLRLGLGFGTVTVDFGSVVPAAQAGDVVEVTVSRRQDDRGQRFVARSLRTASGEQLLRDAQGVPAGN